MGPVSASDIAVHLNSCTADGPELERLVLASAECEAPLAEHGTGRDAFVVAVDGLDDLAREEAPNAHRAVLRGTEHRGIEELDVVGLEVEGLGSRNGEVKLKDLDNEQTGNV